MKKTLKTIICVALCLAMVVTTTTGPVAAGNAEVMQYEHYTILGDSNAAAYGLDAYFANAGQEDVKDGDVIEGSYPDLLTQAVGATTVDQCSHCGWRTDELLRILLNPEMKKDGSFLPGDFSNMYLNALNFIDLYRTPETRKKEGDRIRTAIGEADLITLDIGANDIFTHSINLTTEDYNDAFEDLDIDGIESIADFFALLGAAAPKVKLLDDIWETFTGYMDQNTESFKKNFTQIVKEIKKINPTAKLVVIGMFSPIQLNVETENAVLVDLYTKLDQRIAKINKFMKQQCSEKSGYLFVDVTNTRIFGLKTLDYEKLLAGDENVKYSAVKMLHATEKGYAYQAKQIINALKHETEIPVVTGQYSAYLKRNTVKWDKVDGAVKYQVYRASSEGGQFRLIDTTRKTYIYDIVTLPGVTYYYEVRAVMNTSGSVKTPFSEAVGIKAK